jgi:hypothetical protein
MRQQFNANDVLRLQVQDGWPDLPNLILNPNGEGGAWDWFVYDEDAAAAAPGASDWVAITTASGGNDWLQVRPLQAIPSDADPNTPSGIGGFYAAKIAEAPAGNKVRAALNVQVMDDMPAEYAVGVQFEDDTGTSLGSELFPDPIVLGVNEMPSVDVPAGTTRLVFAYAAAVPIDADHRFRFADAWMVYGSAEDVAASDPLTEPPWVTITGSLTLLEIERDELNVGILTATLKDSTLDPASTDLIRPGKRCRAQAHINDKWEYIFNGTLEAPSSAYEVSNPRVPANKRVTITLVASDKAADLANEPVSSGVATIAELPYVLLGTGVPFNVNGSTAAVSPDSVVTVSHNENASALDQVAITRDSVLGYAWVDRRGRLQAWDRSEISADVAITLDEADYTAANVDFDVARCFNKIYVIVLRINPGTGETEEVRYGPFTDLASVRQWRARRADFTVHGIDEALVDEYAADILATNSTPTRRINSVTLPLRTVTELEDKALLDLYDLVSVSNDLGGVVGQQCRITSLKHRIQARLEDDVVVTRWWLDVDFSTEGNVAAPQVTPSPTVGGTKTLAQLLRPVGEVTMWFGAEADIPAGWLSCDGSTFDGDTYPELEDLLGSTTLPNFEDRFPIGAGTKALGTSGGSSTLDLPDIETPAAGTGWSVDNSGSLSAARLSEFDAHTHTYDGGATVSVLNPWRALWFIIRAA